MEKVLGLVPYLVAVSFVAWLGGRVTSSNLESWYRGLRLPAWRPPDWLFGPVWALLYLLMAVAAWRAARAGADLTWWWIQLALNLLWSYVFFGRKQIGLAVGVILLLLVAIRLTMRAFGMVSPVSGLLLSPYLLWVAFAALLNVTIWRLNRSNRT